MSLFRMVPCVFRICDVSFRSLLSLLLQNPFVLVSFGPLMSGFLRGRSCLLSFLYGSVLAVLISFRKGHGHAKGPYATCASLGSIGKAHQTLNKKGEKISFWPVRTGCEGCRSAMMTMRNQKSQCKKMIDTCSSCKEAPGRVWWGVIRFHLYA